VSRAARRASRPTTSRSRRTPVQPSSSGRGLRVPWIPIAVLLGIVAVVGVVAYLIIQTGKPAANRFEGAAKIEADPAPDLPGEYVNLPEIYADGSTLAHYGATDGPGTAGHVTREVDYSIQGLPPAGGPHWGATTCGPDPQTAPAFCGPVPWGVYFVPWPAASLVHNLEHGGIVVWYNTTDTNIRDQLKDIVAGYGDKNALVVMAPYPEMESETIALTAWGRRDKFPVSEYSEDRVKTFIDKLKCRFNPESMTGFGC
jgi:hypothetical protein